MSCADDTFRDAGIALLGLALFSALAGARVQHAAKRDIEGALPGAKVSVRVEPRGLLGMAVGQAWRAKISGGGFVAQGLPFELEPGGGLKATVRHLELDLHDIVLRDLAVKMLRADVPWVKVDSTRAFFGGHLTLRGAEPGEGVAVVTADGLAAFLRKKRPQLGEVRVQLKPGEATVTSVANLLGARVTAEARGGVGIVDGRYLNAVDATILVGGKPVTPEAARNLLAGLNPVIDVDRDLGLSDWLYVTGAEIGDGILTIRGRVTIPQPRSLPPTPSPKGKGQQTVKENPL